MLRVHKYKHIFKAFLHSEQSGGIILILCTCFSLAISNTLSGTTYVHFWHQYFNLSFWVVDLNLKVEQWINDGLMTVFFILVALEIKRELLIGELNTFAKAILPVGAAMGGMLVPATIHFVFNFGLPTQVGFAIPMATDIAFALGILSLAGKGVPFSLKIFLAALAIIDDLGAIIVIATCYATSIDALFLFSALAIFVLLIVCNLLKVRKLIYYILPGVVMWYCMLQSGVHATIAGVLWAFALPFSQVGYNVSNQVQQKLHYPVALIILPLFSLANTAFVFPEQIWNGFFTPNSLGILLGLVVGKVLGVMGFSFWLLKLKWAQLYDGMNLKNLIGVSMLTGIGFTMSIFITNLAFTQNLATITTSKLSILVASTIAAILGLSYLKFFSHKVKSA